MVDTLAKLGASPDEHTLLILNEQDDNVLVRTVPPCSVAGCVTKANERWQTHVPGALQACALPSNQNAASACISGAAAACRFNSYDT